VALVASKPSSEAAWPWCILHHGGLRGPLPALASSGSLRGSWTTSELRGPSLGEWECEQANMLSHGVATQGDLRRPNMFKSGCWRPNASTLWVARALREHV